VCKAFGKGYAACDRPWFDEREWSRISIWEVLAKDSMAEVVYKSEC